MNIRETRDALETIVDQIGLDGLLYELSGVVDEKAEHIAESYDDIGLSHAWQRAARVIDRAAEHAAVLAVS